MRTEKNRGWGIKSFLLIFFTEIILMLPGFKFDGLVSGQYKTLYYADFQLGFCSRTFVGQLISLVTDNITQEFLCAFVLVNILLYLVIFSGLLSKTIIRCESNAAVLVICALLAVSRCSLRFYFSDGWSTVFDNFWLTITAAAILCMRNKLTLWFVPLLCFFGIGIHYGFVFSFLPLIFALLIFEIYNSKDGRIYKTVVFAVSAVLSAASSVYFVFFANGNLILSKQQAHDYIMGKAGEELPFNLIDGYFYLSDRGKTDMSITETIKHLYSEYMRFELNTFLIILPAVLLFAAFWIYIFRTTREKPLKAVAVINILLPLCCVPAVLSSTDRFRFCVPMILSQAALVLYYCYSGEPHTLRALEKLSRFIKRHAIEIIAACCIWAVYCETEYRDTLYGLQFILFSAAVILIYMDKPLFSFFPVACAAVLKVGFLTAYMPALVIVCCCKSLYGVLIIKKKNKKTGASGKPLSMVYPATYLLLFFAEIIFLISKRKYHFYFYDLDLQDIICAAVLFLLLIGFIVYLSFSHKQKGARKAGLPSSERWIMAVMSVLTVMNTLYLLLLGFSNSVSTQLDAYKTAAAAEVMLLLYFACQREGLYATDGLSPAKAAFAGLPACFFIPAGASVLAMLL